MTVLGIHASKRAPQSGSQEREKLLEHARLVLAVTGHVLLQALEHGLGMSNSFQKLHRHPDASVRSHLLPLHLPLRNVPTLRQRKIILKIIEVKKQPVLEARLRGRKMYAGMLLHKLERLVKAFMAVAIKDQPALGRGGGRLRNAGHLPAYPLDRPCGILHGTNGDDRLFSGKADQPAEVLQIEHLSLAFAEDMDPAGPGTRSCGRFDIVMRISFRQSQMTGSRLIALERSEKVPLPEALFCDECSRGASAVEKGPPRNRSGPFFSLRDLCQSSVLSFSTTSTSAGSQSTLSSSSGESHFAASCSTRQISPFTMDERKQCIVR